MRPAILERLRALPTRSAPLPPEAAAVLGALPLPTVVLDGDDRFRFANPAAELFFQLSASSLATHSLRDLLPPDNRLFGVLEQVRRHEAPVHAIKITGDPPLEVRVNGGVAGDHATVASLVNAIPRVLKAPPGVLMMTDIAVPARA